jgi:hypothetical protein
VSEFARCVVDVHARTEDVEAPAIVMMLVISGSAIAPFIRTLA